MKLMLARAADDRSSVSHESADIIRPKKRKIV